MLGIADEMPLQQSRSSGHGRGVGQRIKEGKGKLGALFICVVSLGTVYTIVLVTFHIV